MLPSRNIKEIHIRRFKTTEAEVIPCIPSLIFYFLVGVVILPTPDSIVISVPSLSRPKIPFSTQRRFSAYDGERLREKEQGVSTHSPIIITIHIAIIIILTLLYFCYVIFTYMQILCEMC